MKNVILRTNAIPVYAFLSHINATQGQGGKILDCGAGGPLPPLALFHQHGFEGWGIDTSEAQLQKSRAFCEEHGVNLNLRQGDMRQIPFEDESFDYVYEHYSMCHLIKRDTARAVQEMHRVLKRGGLCFLGVISLDSWPRSLLGQEKEPGEFWSQEYGDELTVHSAFDDDEADQLVSAWEIVNKEKRVRYLRSSAEGTSLEGWMALYPEAQDRCSEQAWKARYEQRANAFQYVYTYYLLKKPKS
jgi:ubiquinone/menaquinone biosynthesis C-methylase UbiE